MYSPAAIEERLISKDRIRMGTEILNILIPLDFITVISLFLDRMPRVSIVARRVAIGDI